MPRLAWFSPLPPVRSGIAAYSADLLPRLAADFAIDAFVDDAPGRATAGADWVAGVSIRSAHAFVTRHALAPYDLVVYQLGNATCHDYMWPYLLRYPGLVVLHDAGLHHARARLLLARGRKDDYRAEFRYAHPEAPAEAAEFAVAGLQGSPYYLWPLTRLALDSARLVAVHSAGLAAMLSDDAPVPVRVIRMGVPAPAADRRLASGFQRPVPPSASASGSDADHAVVRGSGPSRAANRLLFACFGLITPEKRIPQVLRAFAPVAAARPEARLALVGDTSAHYDVRAEIGALGLQARVEIAGYVADEVMGGWLDAADVCLCLRWPTARETSASWLRCLAAGKPTVITDLAHTTDVPTLDPRTWTLTHTRTDAAATLSPPSARDAVAVALDLLDEDHSLGLALARLASDAALRGQLGGNAQAYWARDHTLEHMTEDYRAAVAAALMQPPPLPPPGRPPHLADDGMGTVEKIAREMGVGVDW